MNKKREQKKFSPAMWVAIGFAVLFAAAEDLPEEAAVMVGLVLLLLVPVVIVYGVLRVVRGRNAAVHSHDRIDHSGDLTINPATGKVERAPVRSGAAHSPREHWKQQLDTLLANGTIDRAEYQQMLKRKF